MKEILGMLSDYGVPLVCSAVLIAMYIADRNKQSKYIYKLLDNSMNNNFHTSKEDVKYDKLYETINEVSYCLRTKCNAGRVQVYMYHNGGKNLAGIPFQKMSCISESVAPGLITFSDSNQNIHRGLYPSISKEFKKNKHYYISDVKDIMRSDPNLYNSFINKSINSVYMYPIYDMSNNIIGFIQLEYMNLDHVTPYNIEDLLEYNSLKISGIMEVMLENNEDNKES